MDHKHLRKGMIAINAKLKLIALFLILAPLPVVPAFADEQVVVQEQGKVKIVVFRLGDYNYCDR